MRKDSKSVSSIMLVGSLALVGWAAGCGGSKKNPGPETKTGPLKVIGSSQPSAGSPVPIASTAGSMASASASAASSAAPPPLDLATYKGPLLGIRAAYAPVYVTPNAARRAKKYGYIRNGAKVPYTPGKVEGEYCKQGFFKVLPYGYVCGRHATENLRDGRVRSGNKPPKFKELLPYKYARNAKHGTPLYRSVPSRKKMKEYEPYLKRKKKRKKKKREPDAASSASAPPALSGLPPATATASAPPAATASAPLPAGSAPPPAASSAEVDTTPWWRRELKKGEKPSVKLSDLTEDSDDVLVKRMVRGFYLSVDRTFRKNRRTWHKTTGGLLAPADRMYLVSAPKFQGQEIDEAHQGMNVAFVRTKNITKYEFDADMKKLKLVGRGKRYDRFFLTGKSHKRGSRLYWQTEKGFWLRDRYINRTEPGPPPKNLAEGEKWIDVNLTRQTLVAFEGTKPVFATMVSTGRKSRVKAKDHRTPRGTWRIREKHVAATMDGDGPAGDLPYSIEDVPYVEYYFRSYALHAAFWHNNFGRRQSHGCTNLSPSDSKRLFMWTEPRVPAGWHGAYSSDAHPGTQVVVHE